MDNDAQPKEEVVQEGTKNGENRSWFRPREPGMGDEWSYIGVIVLVLMVAVLLWK